MISPETHEIAERAKLIYAERLKDELERTHRDAYVVIEPRSGEYFVGATRNEAAAAARAAHPDRIGYMIRVGHRAAIDLSNQIELVRDRVRYGVAAEGDRANGGETTH